MKGKKGKITMERQELKEMLLKILESHTALKATVENELINIRQDIVEHCARIDKLTNNHAKLQSDVTKLGAFAGIMGGGITLLAKFLLDRIF
jgi:hypothetical protein